MSDAEAGKPVLTLKKGARDALWVAGGNYFSLLAGLPLGLITPAFLSPALYGVTAVVDALTELLKHFPLGTLGALSREVSLMRSKGETERALDVRDGVWTFVFCLGLPVIALPVAIARWGFHQTGQFQLCLGLACAAIVSWRLYEVHSELLKSEKRFGADSRIQMAAALVPLPVLPLCLWGLGLVGYFVSAAVTPLVAFFLAARATGERPRFRVAAGIARLILSFGLPLLAVEFIGSAMSNVDRLVLQRFWAAPMLGLYFFAYKFNRYVLAVPLAVGSVMQRNMLAHLASARDETEIAGSVLVPAKFMAYSMAFFLGVVALAGPDLIEALYPRYAGVAEPMRIFLIGAWWPAVAQISAKHLQGVRRLLSPIVAYVLAIGIILGGLSYLGGKVTLASAAIVTCAGFAVRSLAVVFVSLRALSRTPSDIPARFASLLPPFVLLIALVPGLRRGWGEWVAPHWAAPAIAAGLVQAAVFALLFSPLLWMVQRQHSIFERTHAAPPGD